MNGPEHYRRAEALLVSCQDPSIQDLDDDGRVVEFYPERDLFAPGDPKHEHDPANALLAAQVHAALALAAAVAPGHALAVSDLPGRLMDGWIGVLS